MTNFTKTAAVLLISAAPGAWAQRAEGEVQNWQSNLRQKINELNFNNDEANDKLAASIVEKYGFRVSCDRKLYGLLGSLSAENCGAGLVRLESALRSFPLAIEPDYKKTLAIEISRPGYWQGMSALSREIKIPYSANPQTMAGFLGSEIKVGYGTSVVKLMTMNKELLKRIQSTYFAKVIAGPSLDVYQAHEGLKKVELALGLAYDGRTPSAAEYTKFGFDTIVLSLEAGSVYQDQGELRMNVNVADHEGKIFLDMMKAVGRPDEARVRYINASLPGHKVDWSEVVRFREDRARANDLVEGLKAGPLKNAEIRCRLDNAASRSISVAKCKQGLETLNAAVANTKDQNLKDIRRIEIADLIMIGYDIESDSKTLWLDYDSAAETIAEAIRE